MICFPLPYFMDFEPRGFTLAGCLWQLLLCPFFHAKFWQAASKKTGVSNPASSRHASWHGSDEINLKGLNIWKMKSTSCALICNKISVFSHTHKKLEHSYAVNMDDLAMINSDPLNQTEYPTTTKGGATAACSIAWLDGFYVLDSSASYFCYSKRRDGIQRTR